jgi:hypothetical protein
MMLLEILQSEEGATLRFVADMLLRLLMRAQITILPSTVTSLEIASI